MHEAPASLRRPPLNSVSAKIISFVFLSTFLTALVVSWISIQSTHRHLRRGLDASLPAVLHDASSRLEHWSAGGARELADERRNGGGTGWLARSAHHSALVRVGREGEIVSVEGSLDRDTAQAIARALSSEPASLEVRVRVVGIPGSNAHLVAWNDSDGERWIAQFAPAPLADLLHVASIQSQASLHLLDGDLRVLRLPAGEAGAAPAKSFQALIAREAGSVHEYSGKDGRHLLGSYVPIPALGAVLVIEESFEVAFAPVLDVVTRIFLSDLFIILSFSFLAYRITSRIMAPIDALSEGAQRISQGQLDYEIPDPRSRDEIGLLTRTFNEMVRNLREMKRDVESANSRLSNQYEELLSANEVLAQLSITDGLTKLHNHRYFQEYLTREIKRVGRTGEPLAMLLLDLDDFKQFNDRMGHSAGDDLLVRVAKQMSESIRESDLLSRYGGEEFVVLAPNTDLRGAVALAEKIRMAISDAEYWLDDGAHQVRVTLSVGVALYSGDRKAFFQQADRALYQAKAEGKNCVVVAEESRPAR